MEAQPVESLVTDALSARMKWLEDQPEWQRREGAFRLFNGFLEGFPELAIDLYSSTLVLFDHAAVPREPRSLEPVWLGLRDRLPWVDAVIVKVRAAKGEEHRRGILVFGSKPARKVREHSIWYAVDLMLNLDASFYLDTRALRAWAAGTLAGKRVLNTFAYTGSLGVASLAGGARQVIQLDRNRRYLNLAKDSYALNGLPVKRADFRGGDFWAETSQMGRAGELFDCVFVDPPFFAESGRGKVDLLRGGHRVINKVRPLIGEGGFLVVINNALFLSGADFMTMLKELCLDGYLSLETQIDVPPDCTGFPETRRGRPPADPAPFNHSTKIAILRVRRKDGRTA